MVLMMGMIIYNTNGFGLETTPKPFKTKSRSKIKTSILTTLHSNHNFVQREVSLKVSNTPLYTNQKETNQETS
jgi:hypothetical protein